MKDPTQAQRSLEQRLRDQYRQSLVQQGLVNVDPPKSSRQLTPEEIEAMVKEDDERIAKEARERTKLPSFTAYNRGEEKIKGPSQIRDKDGNARDNTPNSVTGPTLEGLEAADKRAAARRLAELEAAEEAKRVKEEATPDKLVAAIEYLTRTVKRMEKDVKSLKKEKSSDA